ncbi:unnamed protein product [Rotaria sp. Silwood2]|nr:unnamed protein product [Rotaria sp. Silwood2]CAF2847242.1 unnamed protein product [Rotaria sp. Silwood2]CAF4046087.1 unnamed protein product [Rotaria sp. Silwood2]
MNSPTIKISKMLDELIRSLFDQYAKQTTIIDDVHLIRQLEKYINLGGVMGSPFTLTLANIFMWHWEQKIVEHQKFSNELCGDSYIDDIFLTSNDSIEKQTQILEDANKYHSNIKLTYDIGNSISFLDLQMTNHDGNVTTSVHHKDAAEPYVVPFKSDHSCHIFENIIRAALLRALRYSSTLKEFNHERRAIKLMLLYNRYSLSPFT